MIVKYYGNLAQKIVFTKYKHWKIWILNCYTHSFKLERDRNFDNYDKNSNLNAHVYFNLTPGRFYLHKATQERLLIEVLCIDNSGT